MIIDGHVHVHPDADGMGRGYDARVETLLSAMDGAGVDRAVIYAEAVEVPYIKPISNAFVGECCSRYPEKLIGFASVHPAAPQAEGAFREAVERYGLRGLKLHPRFQGVPADDPRAIRLVEAATGLGLPVAIDALLGKSAPLRMQLMINVDNLCKRVPEARIILAHAGGFHFLDALAVVVANPNVYLETSLALGYFRQTPFEDQFFFVLKQAGADRVIYGSDYPQKPMKETLDASREALEQHGFDVSEREKILGETLLALLKNPQGAGNAGSAAE